MVKTIEYSAGVTPVDFSQAIPYGGSNRYYAVMNYGKKDIFISNKNDAAEGADGSKRVPAGECRGIDMQGLNVLYIAAQSAGTAEIDTAAGISSLGFRSSARGGDDTVSEEGNPVQIDGLQGGVPFNEISVSGKNLIPYPYASGDTWISHGVTFTVNSDGTITANGTISEDGYLTYTLYSGGNLYLPVGTYTLSGLPNPDTITTAGRIVITFLNETNSIIYNQKGGKCTFTLSEIKAIDNIYIRWYTEGTVFDNVIFKPQLELGNTATEYAPPITGREMILNVNGAEYTIKPDSNPYTVPVDITQYDGINVLSIADDSNPIISVSGNKASEQLSKIYSTLDNKPVLLFDGNIPTSSMDGYAEFTVDKEYTALMVVPTCNTSSTYILGVCTVIPMSYIESTEKDFSVTGSPRGTDTSSRAYIKRDGNTIYVRETSTTCDYMTIYGI